MIQVNTIQNPMVRNVRANIAGIYQGFHRDVGEVFEYDFDSASYEAIQSNALEHIEGVPDGIESKTAEKQAARDAIAADAAAKRESDIEAEVERRLKQREAQARTATKAPDAAKTGGK
jgi:hypothetical protein